MNVPFRVAAIAVRYGSGQQILEPEAFLMIVFAVPMISVAILVAFAVAWAAETLGAEARPVRMLDFHD